jgi:hypothetical protein
MGVFITELMVRVTAYGWNLSSLLAKVLHHNPGKKG